MSRLIVPKDSVLVNSSPIRAGTVDTNRTVSLRLGRRNTGLGETETSSEELLPRYPRSCEKHCWTYRNSLIWMSFSHKIVPHPLSERTSGNSSIPNQATWSIQPKDLPTWHPIKFYWTMWSHRHLTSPRQIRGPINQTSFSRHSHQYSFSDS